MTTVADQVLSRLAYWYIGLRQAAFAFQRAGDRAFAVELHRLAARLKKRFAEISTLAAAPTAPPISRSSCTASPGHASTATAGLHQQPAAPADARAESIFE